MILSAWNLPDLGQTASAPQIDAPWNMQQGATANNPPIAQAVTPGPVTTTFTAIPKKTASSTPNTAAGELPFPIRAAFYYPWFPQSWSQGGMTHFTHYHPTSGYYNEDDFGVIQQQIAAMQYGKIQLGIASWWGQGHYTDGRIPALIQAGEQSGFHWALYVESEGQGDPSVDAIRSDLEYIRDHYASSPAYLKINGHFVVFAYADKNDSCGMTDRWKQANTAGAYVVLKVFPGYRDCASQPDAWHQYAPDTSEKKVGKSSFTISPGFWKATEYQPRLVRDLNQWSLDIQSMVASKSNFQLITTFNEWGEGTSVESGTKWESPSGYGLYLDALHFDGVLPTGLAPTTSPTPHP
jgi:hypothetical protein